MEHERDSDTNCNWRDRFSHKRISTEVEDLEIRGRLETIQTIALLRSATIQRRVLET